MSIQLSWSGKESDAVVPARRWSYWLGGSQGGIAADPARPNYFNNFKELGVILLTKVYFLFHYPGMCIFLEVS